MLKISSIAFLLVLSVHGHFASSFPFSQSELRIELFSSDARSSTWAEHVNDFIALVEIDKILLAKIKYLNDPEVQNFMTFVSSSKFKQIVWEFESIAEFKEAFTFLTDNGYDVESAINFINTALLLPPYEKSKLTVSPRGVAKGKGLTGFIEDVIATLPLEEMKKLFESKLETSPEVSKLFETINSPEFMDIMKKMSKNPKFIEIKKIFGDYGLDFKHLCTLAKDILGEYYQGVFCEI